MLTALLLILAAADFATQSENTPPTSDEAVALISPTEESTVAPPLPNPAAVPADGQSADEKIEQNLDDTQTPEPPLANPYRIPLTILTALVCGLLFLFFRQTE